MQAVRGVKVAGSRGASGPALGATRGATRGATLLPLPARPHPPVPHTSRLNLLTLIHFTPGEEIDRDLTT